MTQEERNQINKANAQHSTGPKTEEGKAKSSQNALTHGLFSAIPPLHNPDFLEIFNDFQEEFPSQTRSHRALVLELAHLGWKVEQLPAMEYEAELNSGLTLAQHFMQDEPTPLVKLWAISNRIHGRYNSLLNKLQILKMQNKPNNRGPDAPSDVDVHVDESSVGTPQEDKTPSAPTPIVQNKPSGASVPLASPPSAPTPPNEQNKPTPHLALGIGHLASQSPALQNEPTPTTPTTLAELEAAVEQNKPIVHTFESLRKLYRAVSGVQDPL